MRRSVVSVMFLLSVVTVFCLAGCGGGGGGAASSEGSGVLKSVGWYFENDAPDYSNNGVTCVLNIGLFYDETVATSDIASFTVTAPNGVYWNIVAPNLQFGTNSSGKPIISGRLNYGDNTQTFPLAGTWTAQIKLQSGATSALQLNLHEPGSSSSATHAYLYTKEDWTPSTNSDQYVAALARFPSQGYTVHYLSINGGSITTSGLSAVRSNFLAGEPKAYNFYCWLYDANKTYLGYTNTAYSTRDHSNSNLITTTGELSIVPASTAFSSGTVDLSRVKYLRFLYNDGAQFAPGSYSNLDNRSISALVPVN
jgi:hypothetical protein